jgi:predicted metalloprotease
MRWQDREESSNVEDRRGMSPRGKGVAGGGIGVLIIALLVMAMGGDPSALLNAAGSQPSGQQASGRVASSPEEEELKKLVGVTLKDTETVWNEIMPKQLGRPYEEPKLVMFSGSVQSACGYAESAMGPFYCGSDRQVYIDLSFYELLRDRFKAAGDFAQAYVIAHEVGHHIQNLTGIMDQVHEQRSRISEKQYNDLSVRLELQADFYAGVWAHHAQGMASLDKQDIEEAITAASAIGDDAIQMQTQGHIVPDAFTHGTSEQRVRWFMKGFQSGNARLGDETFRLAKP